MTDPYLWEKRGAADPFAARLETALREKRTKVQAIGIRRRRHLGLLSVASVVAATAACLAFWPGSRAPQESRAQPAQEAPSAPLAVEENATPTGFPGRAEVPGQPDVAESDETKAFASAKKAAAGAADAEPAAEAVPATTRCAGENLDIR